MKVSEIQTAILEQTGIKMMRLTQQLNPEKRTISK